MIRRIPAAFRLAVLELRTRRRRILALLAFAGIFLAAAATAATLARGTTERVEFDRLFQLGGFPLVSGMLLTGWLLGRFPVAATLVLMSGIIAGDREAGHARVLAARPVPPALLYGTRFAVLAAVAFAICGVLMPLFDLIMLGEWAGPATLILILAHVLVWGGLTTLLSVFTSLDAWMALLLAILAMVWSALAGAGMLPLAAALVEITAFVLPPQAQLFALESAFGDVQPIPWGAFAFAAGYGVLAIMGALFFVGRREI